MTSFIWTLDFKHAKHQFLNSNGHEDTTYFDHTYLGLGGTDETTSFWRLRNTVGVSMLEGFNRNDKVRTGMFARVNFNYGTTHSVVVPDRAVQKQVGSGVRYVWVYQGGEVELREIELGQRLEDRYEVKGGLVSGTQVVIAGASRLQDGAKVQLKK